ncbi:hypothetical protein NPIL_641671 [Nephila pilipes]|uniref:Uncharacterized protein n=1 Tax=Nephila pilipes TaxID=299642 RepID=A0A8X6NQD4_NEPPI|nr:hypothetical protein NPIL_641671 [Nephila pilipes]
MEPPEMYRQPYVVDRRINLSNLYSHLNYEMVWIAVFLPILHAFNYRSSWGKLLLSLFSCGTTFALKMDSGKLNIMYQALNVNNLSSFSFVSF